MPSCLQWALPLSDIAWAFTPLRVHWLVCAQVYTRLAERLGLSDHLMVLNVMLAKIATNLKAFGSCEDVVEQTLNLFQVSAVARHGAANPHMLRTTDRNHGPGPSTWPDPINSVCVGGSSQAVHCYNTNIILTLLWRPL